MVCSPRDLNALRSIGVLDENGSLNLDGIEALCRGVAEAYRDLKRECPTCVEEYREVVLSPNPLKKLLVLMGCSERCAEIIARRFEAREACLKGVRGVR